MRIELYITVGEKKFKWYRIFLSDLEITFRMVKSNKKTNYNHRIETMMAKGRDRK